MPELDLQALVRNRTLSAPMAALLVAVARERRSFLIVAIPRMAGKSTVMDATLAHAPEGTAIQRLMQHPRDLDGASEAPPEGYLVVPEVSQAPVPGYIWGDTVRRVFAQIDRGYALATALHAPGVREAFEVLTSGNGLSDAHASHLQLMVYIRSLGEWSAPTRRAVAEMHEIDGVSRGVPNARLLFRWDEAADRFDAVDQPAFLGGSQDLDAIAERLDRGAVLR